MIGFEAIIETQMLTPRSVKQITRVAGRVTMLTHRTRLPLHFEYAAIARYGYKPRKKSYQVRKARAFGTTAPLVRTGGLRTAILANAAVTATSNRATLKSRGSKTNQLQPQFKTEIEAIAPDEERAVTKEFRETFVVLAGRPEYARRVRRKVT